MIKVEKIIIHCSASIFGDRDLIDEWHKERGWNGIGYHFVILNGYSKSFSQFKENDNGRVELGRDSGIQGAHCLGQNKISLGVCLIGDKLFTERQLLVSLPRLLCVLMEKYFLAVDDIYGHGEFNKDKSCPNIDMDIYRDFLRSYRSNEEETHG